jgi:hypothetical protein
VKRPVVAAFVTALALTSAGCGGQTSAPPAPEQAGSRRPPRPATEPTEAAAPPMTEVAPAEDLTAKLAAADKADGAEDHVVSKCTGCLLGMSGDRAHAVTFGEYTLHLCSEGCKQAVGADPAKAVAALPPPQS